MKRRFVLSRVPRTCSVRPSDPSCSAFEGVLPARSANFSYLGCYAFRIGCLSAPVQVVLWENQKLQVVSGNDCTNGLHCIVCSGSICRNELALICFFLSYSHCSSFPWLFSVCNHANATLLLRIEYALSSSFFISLSRVSFMLFMLKSAWQARETPRLQQSGRSKDGRIRNSFKGSSLFGIRFFFRFWSISIRSPMDAERAKIWLEECDCT
jgi:hypothetical protein